MYHSLIRFHSAFGTPMDPDLHRAIRRTLAWFSLFQYAPTAFELRKWLFLPGAKPALEPVDAALREGAYAHADGYFALPGADVAALARARRARRTHAMRKMRALRRAVGFLRHVPGVRGIAAANTLAFMHAREDSDIDLFVRTRPGLTWTARLLCVAPFALLRRRPEDGARDPFCFSFFASTAAPDLSTLAIPGGDPYLDVWIRSLRPVTEVKPRGGGKPWGFGHRGLTSCERLAKFVQLRRLPARLRALMNADSRVVVNDDMLKFHENDRRAEYRDRWHALCRQYDCLA